MRVAIIGAGLAGLSCAHELESLGINPFIYEKNSFIGEEFPHVGAALKIAVRPIKDVTTYIRDNFKINIEPLANVNKVIHYSPNKRTVIEGDLGCFLERDKTNTDIKNQIFSQLSKTTIYFNTITDYEKLLEEYDKVIIANGYVNFTKELGCWHQWINTYVYSAVVSGKFDPNCMIVWVNKDYCKNGYAYLTPFNECKSSIALVVTDVNEHELENYWEVFINTENIKYQIEERYKINHISGFAYPHSVDDIYFAGNAGGAMDPFLGFGVLSSITTGVMAARAVALNMDYEKLIKGVEKQNLRLYNFRKAFNKLDNKDYDILISSIGVPGLKHLVYYTPLNVIKAGSGIIRLIERSKG